jgi:hypothetical protein
MPQTPSQLIELAVISGGFALGGIVFGALVAGLYGLRAKRNEYVNDYYKTVVHRRITAYEHLEALIMDYRMSIVDEDKKPYHAPILRGQPTGERLQTTSSNLGRGTVAQRRGIL